MCIYFCKALALSLSKIYFSVLDLKAQRYVTQLKSQINSLEAELEEQRMQKQRALVENEQLRMELEVTRRRNAEQESLQSTFIEAESKMCLETFVQKILLEQAKLITLIISVCEEKAQATEQRYNKLKEKHTELVASHAELLRKVHTPEQLLIACHHLVLCFKSVCANVLTECRHCEDAVSHPADSGGSGEDKAAAEF